MFLTEVFEMFCEVLGGGILGAYLKAQGCSYG